MFKQPKKIVIDLSGPFPRVFSNVKLSVQTYQELQNVLIRAMSKTDPYIKEQ